MQLLDRFEQRVDALVNGALSAGARAEVQPIEIAAALQREIDDHAVDLVEAGRVVPNAFTIDLSPRDFERLMAFEAPLRAELGEVVREYTAAKQFHAIGAPAVCFREDPALSTGLFRVRAEAKQDVSVEAARTGPRLIVDGLTHPLTRHTTRIGRGTDVDIRIDDAGVSRHHAEIVLTDPIVLRDLESTNGTWVNRERISEMPLLQDTTITIGPAVIEFRLR